MSMGRRQHHKLEAGADLFRYIKSVLYSYIIIECATDAHVRRVVYKLLLFGFFVMGFQDAKLAWLI
jgi:hypothetical protein